MNPTNETLIREQAKNDGITHISTGVAIWKGGKILIVRRSAADFLGGHYELPGGGVDEGELITDAAIREAKEETGLTVSRIIATFDGFDYSTDRKPHVRQINFLVEVEDGEVLLNHDEHDEFRWADETDFDDVPTSDNMKLCFVNALRTARNIHLYLITLEVDPLVVSEVYNPLPSHLTLVSRFWSKLQPDVIIASIQPILTNTKLKELVFGEEEIIGPKKTAVHLIKNTLELKSLHLRLLEVLNNLNVLFTSPQFIGAGHRPHVSKRQDIHYPAGSRRPVHHAYLIEVEILGEEHLRYIRAKLKLGA
jgi:8-oxo-dGTP diphosphatase